VYRGYEVKTYDAFDTLTEGVCKAGILAAAVADSLGL
jgi:hypothetical protein